MSYVYLFNLYKKIDFRLNEIKVRLADEEQTPHQITFLEGRKDALLEFRNFLTLNLDSKLPKRIRKQLSKSNG